MNVSGQLVTGRPRAVAAEHGVQLSYAHVDAACLWMVDDPQRFDVIAITDHDLFAGVRRAAAAIAQTRASMILVPAAEITSFLHFGCAEAEHAMSNQL